MQSTRLYVHRIYIFTAKKRGGCSLMFRFGFLVVLVLVAFAANSLLNRWALLDSATGPASFALVRLLAGAAILVVLVGLRDQKLTPKFAFRSVVALAVYVLGFSFAYVQLEAGLGALILFGGVQVTLFGLALSGGEQIRPMRWVGTLLAVVGLVWLLSPGELSLDGAQYLFLMILAAIGWGVYTCIGKSSNDPMGDTAWNFVFAAPIGLLVWVLLSDGISMAGFALAVVSGALTSGVGYALWYSILPKLTASMAGILQLTVPVIAFGAGAAFLGEVITLQIVAAACLVLLGAGIAALSYRR